VVCAKLLCVCRQCVTLRYTNTKTEHGQTEEAVRHEHILASETVRARSAGGDGPSRRHTNTYLQRAPWMVRTCARWRLPSSSENVALKRPTAGVTLIGPSAPRVLKGPYSHLRARHCERGRVSQPVPACERAAYRHPRACLVHALAGESVDDRQRRRAQQSVSKELLIANGQARSTWIYTSLCVVRSIPGITARRRCKNKNRACRAKTKNVGKTKGQ